MKTLRSHAIGGPDALTLDDIADPVPGKGQVLVKVHACSINFPDTLMIRDLYQFKPERPYAPGGELAGVIEALGESVTGWNVGDRVIASTGHGGLAEKVVAEQHRLFPLPEGVSFETGASLLMTYGTTIHGLKDRGHIKAGDVLLILGAAGGVGISAIELGKAYGARVIAAVSSEEKAAVARECGADDMAARRSTRCNRRRWPNSSRPPAVRTARTSSTTSSAATIPNPRSGRSRGKASSWSSGSRRGSPSCR
jgi:NADPH2:quinone reductase